LWKAREWALLEQMSRDQVDAQRDHPALVFLAAALFETGREKEGAALALEYSRDYRLHWTMCYGAVGFYYPGLAALPGGDQKRGLKNLAEAFTNHPYDCIADAMEQHSGLRPEKPRNRWEGRRFPSDYRLAQVGTSNTVSLGGTMALMSP